MIFIYIIVNRVNGKVYIGSTKDITIRFNKHKNTLNQFIHHNEHLQRAWNKYGSDSFEFKTLMVCPDNERNHCEQMMMDLYNSQNHNFGYNIRDADEHSVSEETRLKISKANSGKTRSKEHKQKISEANKGKTSWNKGIPMSDKTKEKISGENNVKWKNYARITKQGFQRGKQQYGIRFNGKTIRRSTNIILLKKWFKDNYPNEELVIDAKN